MLEVSLCGDSTGRKFINLPKLYTMIVRSRSSKINRGETGHDGMEWIRLA